MSGGSDFHGTRKTNHNLGTGNGNLYISENIVKKWIDRYFPSFESVEKKKVMR